MEKILDFFAYIALWIVIVLFILVLAIAVFILAIFVISSIPVIIIYKGVKKIIHILNF